MSSSAAGPGAQVTFTWTSYSPYSPPYGCSNRGSTCNYDVRWGDPNTGPTLCTMSVGYVVSQYPRCSGTIPVGPQGGYTAFIVDAGCRSSCTSYDSGPFSINADGSEGTYDSSTSPSPFNPDDPYPRVADPADPGADTDVSFMDSDPTGVVATTASMATSSTAGSSVGTPVCGKSVYTQVGWLSFATDSRTGRFTWDFRLSRVAQADVGSPILMRMPFASVNGQTIQPPYPYLGKLENSDYSWHSSMLNYNIIGDGTRTIKPGDLVVLTWFFTGPLDHGHQSAICRVPSPGA